MTWLSDLPIVTIVTFLPALGALVIAFTPTDRPNMARYLGLGFALAAWVVSLVMLAGFVAGDPAFQFTESVAWIPAFGINYAVGVDGLSIVLVVLTTTLTWISILASFGPIQSRVKEYMISFLVLEVGMIGVFVAMDLFLFYIFWELVLRADVPAHRHLGRQEPHLRHDQVRPLHPGRLAAHAGRDPGDRVHLPGGARRQLAGPSTCRRWPTTRRRAPSAAPSS